jgi:hypothetical protein
MADRRWTRMHQHETGTRPDKQFHCRHFNISARWDSGTAHERQMRNETRRCVGNERRCAELFPQARDERAQAVRRFHASRPKRVS